MKVKIVVQDTSSKCWDEPESREALIARVLAAGLMNQVLLICPHGIRAEPLFEIVRGTAGAVQLELFFIESQQSNQNYGTTAVLTELLNLGASKIWWATAGDFQNNTVTGLPAERCQLIRYDDGLNAVHRQLKLDRLGQVLSQQEATSVLLVADQPWISSAAEIAGWLWSRLSSDRADGLIPTMVADSDGRALGLAYSNADSLQLALEQRRGVYWSRSRQTLWRKGDSSGCPQELRQVVWDCDADTLLFMVDQGGSGFCHEGTRTCFGPLRQLPDVWSRLAQQMTGDDTHSYSRKLIMHPELLHKKIVEEAHELAAAVTRPEAVSECADLVYFSCLQLLRHGATWNQVEAELGRRMLRLVRRHEKPEDLAVLKPLAGGAGE